MRNVQESSRKVAKLAFPVGDVPADVGRRVSGARMARRWTQERLAIRSGLSRAAVYRLEGGAGGVRADTLFRVAHALDICIRELVPAWPEWEPISGHGQGEDARERRRALGLTLVEVAAGLGVSEATLSRFERGIGASRLIPEPAGDEVHFRDHRLAQPPDAGRGLMPTSSFCRLVHPVRS